MQLINKQVFANIFAVYNSFIALTLICIDIAKQININISIIDINLSVI